MLLLKEIPEKRCVYRARNHAKIQGLYGLKHRMARHGRVIQHISHRRAAIPLSKIISIHGVSVDDDLLILSRKGQRLDGLRECMGF